MENKLILKIKNELTELPVVNLAFNEFAEKNSLSEKTQNDVNLILEEILVNIISYAFDDKFSHEIDVRIEITDRELKMSFIDDGKYFDPTRVFAPDPSLSIEEMPIGGLGIHLVKSKVRDIKYQRHGGKNILKLIKEL